MKQIHIKIRIRQTKKQAARGVANVDVRFSNGVPAAGSDALLEAVKITLEDAWQKESVRIIE